MSEQPQPAPRVTILFVCTANRARSPFAAALAHRLGHEQRLPIEVSSAGFADGGEPAVGPMVSAALEVGLDLDAHLSRRVDASMISAADLVVAMSGRHVIDLVGLDPGAARRVLTLRELAAGSAAHGAPRWEPAEARSWAATVTDRPIDVVLSGDLDVADPIGGSRRTYRRTVAEITTLLEQALVPVPPA